MLLFKLGGEFSNFGSADATDHGRIFLTELHKFFAQALLLCIGSRVGMIEERACGYTPSEPLMLGQADNEWAEDILHFFVAQIL